MNSLDTAWREILKEIADEVLWLDHQDEIDKALTALKSALVERLEKMKKEKWVIAENDVGRDDGNKCGYAVIAKVFENAKIDEYNIAIAEVKELLK